MKLKPQSGSDIYIIGIASVIANKSCNHILFNQQHCYFSWDKLGPLKWDPVSEVTIHSDQAIYYLKSGMTSGWSPSSQVSLQIPWNQWSFDQSDCHSNFVDNLIDTVGEGVESDVSSGDIRGCFMLAQGWLWRLSYCQPLFDKQAGRDTWTHKQTDTHTQYTHKGIPSYSGGDRCTVRIYILTTL